MTEAIRKLADSVMLGGVAAFLAATCLILASLNRGAPSESAFPAIGGFVLVIGAPALAIINVFFVVRDRKAGHRKQALLGLGLSVLTILAAWLPILGVGDRYPW